MTYPPYGTSPYGEPGEPPATPAPSDRMDGISLAALITSLTCCAAPVAIGLGIGGLVRTSGGRRRGRWAAWTGLAVGILGTLALVAALVGFLWIGVNTVPEDEAEVGECVDVTRMFDANDLWQASCSEPHDAEIVAVGVLTEAEADRLEAAGPAGFCGEVAAGELGATADDPSYELGIATDGIEDEPDEGDAYACFVARADGDKLDEPLLG